MNAQAACQRCGGSIDVGSGRCRRCDLPAGEDATIHRPSVPYSPMPPPPPMWGNNAPQGPSQFQPAAPASYPPFVAAADHSDQLVPGRPASTWFAIAAVVVLVIGATVIVGLKAFSTSSTNTASSISTDPSQRGDATQSSRTSPNKVAPRSTSSPDTDPVASAFTIPVQPTGAAPITVAATTTTIAPTTTLAATVPLTVPPTPASTVVAAAIASLPVPVVTVAPAFPGVPDAAVPHLFNGALRSGLAVSDVWPSFLVAQSLADALGRHDWATANFLQGKNDSDATYAKGYSEYHGAGLLLLDARPEGNGYRFLVVSVADETPSTGEQTTLWCLQWSASASANSVKQQRGGHKLQTEPFVIDMVGVKSDPSMNQLIQSNCQW